MLLLKLSTHLLVLARSYVVVNCIFGVNQASFIVVLFQNFKTKCVDVVDSDAILTVHTRFYALAKVVHKGHHMPGGEMTLVSYLCHVSDAIYKLINLSNSSNSPTEIQYNTTQCNLIHNQYNALLFS